MVLTHRVRLLALCTLARAASGVRSVLVTGANKGIGRAIVQKIVEDYDDVHVFLGCRSAQRGEEAAAAIASAVPGCADHRSARAPSNGISIVAKCPPSACCCSQ